jgi:hypothetical protein
MLSKCFFFNTNTSERSPIELFTISHFIYLVISQAETNILIQRRQGSDAWDSKSRSGKGKLGDEGFGPVRF